LLPEFQVQALQIELTGASYNGWAPARTIYYRTGAGMALKKIGFGGLRDIKYTDRCASPMKGTAIDGIVDRL